MTRSHDPGPSFTGPWETLTCRMQGAVAVLTLNRPDKLNVMNVAMRDELGDCLLALGRDERARALVVTGAGKAFCAGGDMNDFTGQSAESMQTLMHTKSHRWFRALWDLTIPTIAAVNGVAAGGGTNLTLACDIILAGEDARFGQTFQKAGLMPDLGGLFLLPRSVGLHQAKALCLSGELVGAERARELGFVQEVVPGAELLDRSLALAERLAAGPPAAYAATKAMLNRSFERSMEETLQSELYAQAFLFSTEEHHRRLDGFLRPAVGA